jgi:hypothetical protein
MIIVWDKNRHPLRLYPPKKAIFPLERGRARIYRFCSFTIILITVVSSGATATSKLIAPFQTNTRTPWRSWLNQMVCWREREGR